jgi:hypothetical protein
MAGVPMRAAEFVEMQCLFCALRGVVTTFPIGSSLSSLKCFIFWERLELGPKVGVQGRNGEARRKNQRGFEPATQPDEAPHTQKHSPMLAYG